MSLFLLRSSSMEKIHDIVRQLCCFLSCWILNNSGFQRAKRIRGERRERGQMALQQRHVAVGGRSRNNRRAAHGMRRTTVGGAVAPRRRRTDGDNVRHCPCPSGCQLVLSNFPLRRSHSIYPKMRRRSSTSFLSLLSCFSRARTRCVCVCVYIYISPLIYLTVMCVRMPRSFTNDRALGAVVVDCR